MAAKVEIINNPYLQLVQILIDGQAVSVYSNLEKFMDEPFVYWCDKILPALHDELNGSAFELHFRSSKEEVEIMQAIASQTPYCIQFSSSGFVRKMTLVERMAKLNDLIKTNALSGYKRQGCRAIFAVPDQMSSLCDELRKIEIKNLYCNVEVVAVTYAEYLQNTVKGDITFVVCNKGDEKKATEKLSIRNGFLLAFGQQVAFTCKMHEILCYETTMQELFNSIFTCFIVGPLGRIFTQTVGGLSADIKQRFSEQIETLLSTSLRVIPKPESLSVEVGHSVQLAFEADIEGYVFQKKDFIFDYQPKGIIRCNGMRVEGLKEGNATLIVYREGENKPCAQLQYVVIKRNRITELRLMENEIYVGEGDRYKFEFTFFPADADNADLITWQTEDESIVSIDNRGKLRAVKVGECIVRVLADNICDSCTVIVLPHLKDIIVDENDIVLMPGDTVQIKATPSPKVCIDDHLKYACMDVRIANVVGTELKAIACGETELVIQNAERTVTKKIRVIVRGNEGKKPKKEKKGIFSKLFG